MEDSNVILTCPFCDRHFTDRSLEKRAEELQIQADRAISETVEFCISVNNHIDDIESQNKLDEETIGRIQHDLYEKEDEVRCLERDCRHLEEDLEEQSRESRRKCNTCKESMVGKDDAIKLLQVTSDLFNFIDGKADQSGKFYSSALEHGKAEIDDLRHIFYELETRIFREIIHNNNY